MRTILLVLCVSVLGATAEDIFDKIRPQPFEGKSPTDGAIPGEYIAVLTLPGIMSATLPTASSEDDTTKRVKSVITKLLEFSIQTVKRLQVGATQALFIKGEESKVQQAKASVNTILYVEPNAVFSISNGHCVNQTTTLGMWGLDRIDQHGPVVNINRGVYNHDKPASPSSDVDVYILDTGIRTDHVLFGNRASWGYTAFGINDGDVDGNGHGTHVAGIVGSTTYGVAKDVRLIAVKVLDNHGFGTTASVINGINWVFNEHRVKNTIPGSRGTHKAIMNLSLRKFGSSRVLESLLNDTINSGVTAVVGAGNAYGNACFYTPARLPDAITVGAIDSADKVTNISNWGRCLDVFAPGEEILSTYHTSSTSTHTDSGTSMAAPHVTGALATLFKEQQTPPSKAVVAGLLVFKASTYNRINFTNDNERSSPNIMIYAYCHGNAILPGMIAMIFMVLLCMDMVD